jgi:hypothetical protein
MLTAFPMFLPVPRLEPGATLFWTEEYRDTGDYSSIESHLSAL